jgi:hypothetical protein
VHRRSPAFSQAPTSFEVADVKVNKSGEIRMAVDFQSGGRLSMRNVPMRVMIVMAYNFGPMHRVSAVTRLCHSRNPGAIKFEPCDKRFVTLRDDMRRGVGKNLSHCLRGPASEPAITREKRQYLGQSKKRAHCVLLGTP